MFPRHCDARSRSEQEDDASIATILKSCLIWRLKYPLVLNRVIDHLERKIKLQCCYSAPSFQRRQESTLATKMDTRLRGYDEAE